MKFIIVLLALLLPGSHSSRILPFFFGDPDSVPPYIDYYTVIGCPERTTGTPWCYFSVYTEKPRPRRRFLGTSFFECVQQDYVEYDSKWGMVNLVYPLFSYDVSIALYHNCSGDGSVYHKEFHLRKEPYQQRSRNYLSGYGMFRFGKKLYEASEKTHVQKVFQKFPEVKEWMNDGSVKTQLRKRNEKLLKSQQDNLDTP